MTKQIVVLGTSHPLQGAVNSRRQKIDDPSYRRLVEQLISSYRIEIIFEEAAGCGPTEAQKIAGLAKIRYMDVDPSPAERVRLGMRPKPPRMEDGIPIDERGLHRYYLNDVEVLEAQEQRESYWLREIKESDFNCGLLICGYMHGLSLAFRFRAAGFRAELIDYIPLHKLCPRKHADSLELPKNPPDERL